MQYAREQKVLMPSDDGMARLRACAKNAWKLVDLSWGQLCRLPCNKSLRTHTALQLLPSTLDPA